MKQLMALTLSALSVLSYAQIPDYVPTDGLVVYFPLNNTLLDQTESELHLISHGGTFSTDRFGNANMAYAFDGESWLETSGNIPLFGTESRTLAFWALVETPTDVIAVSQGMGGTGSRFEGGFNYVDQGVFISGANTVITYESEYPTTTWNHYVFVKNDNGTVADVTVYQNGLVLSNPLYIQNLDVILNTEQSPLFLGKGLGASNGQEFIGLLDEVGIWNRALTPTEIGQLYTDSMPPITGCTHVLACNFNEQANEDDGSCDYSCCPGPGCCGEGTIWNGQNCVVAQFNDTNFDLCIGLPDLLDVLTGYGLCFWQCGDYLSFGGYEYRTAQIGSRCWCIENLRTENFASGEPILQAEESADWSAAADSAIAAFCTPLASETDIGFGFLYNGFAVRDERSLCPTGWHVSNNDDWFDLLYEAGSEPLSHASMNNGSGTQLKSSPQDAPAWDGSNDLQFSALNAGGRYRHGGPVSWDSWYWSFTPSEPGQIALLPNWRFVSGSNGVFWGSDNPANGGSVRCVRNSN
jgi:uncharacterized protein (TIGR02145 family)